jgi:hypothetical protein
VLFFEVPFLHAQSLFNIPQTATLKANPSYPGPNTSVTISLDDYSIDTVGARITWLVDGTELKDETNARSIKIQTGKLGQKKVIKTILSRPSAPSITSSLVLIPVAVDIILEAKTYTPLFYTGRPLPSMESPMRAIALVQTGGAQGPESFTYIWSLGATVLNGGPIKGKYMLDFVMPRYDQKTLSVQVLDQNGTPIGRSAATLEAEEPEILFYEHSALRGLGQKTIASPYPLLGEEATIYGEPYFTHSAVGADTTSFDWKIDGEDATSEPGIPNAISLRRTGDAGSARISLSVTTKDRIPQFVSNTFNLFFK